MNSSSDHLQQPPFPIMVWSDCDWWEGEIDLSYESSVPLNVTPYDPEVSRLPSTAQADALAYQIEFSSRVLEAVLAALLPYYESKRPVYLDYLGADFEELMPTITDASELGALIEIAEIHIHPWTKDGMAYVGLQFGCTWDREHGLGFMMHRDRVVEVGSADVSFAWSPAEVDEA